jgi:hypothetical protein
MGKSASEYIESDFKASVGKFGIPKRECYNTVSDQEMVRILLNAVPIRYGGRYNPNDPTRQLTGDLKWGKVRNDLYAAIVDFQKNPNNRAEGLITDGHIDPHEKTIKRLLYLANWQPPVPTGDTIQRIPHLSSDVDIPAPNFDDDLNTVFAGTRFKIKMLSAESVGAIMGASYDRFKIWDVDNHRAAFYDVIVAGITLGPAPASVSWKAGDWSDFFTPTNAVQVDMFACKVHLSSTSAMPITIKPPSFPGMPPMPPIPSSILRLEFSGTNDFLGCKPFHVSVPTPTGITFPGYDTMEGELKLSGSVEVFKGP